MRKIALLFVPLVVVSMASCYEEPEDWESVDTTTTTTIVKPFADDKVIAREITYELNYWLKNDTQTGNTLLREKVSHVLDTFSLALDDKQALEDAWRLLVYQYDDREEERYQHIDYYDRAEYTLKSIELPDVQWPVVIPDDFVGVVGVDVPAGRYETTQMTTDTCEWKLVDTNGVSISSAVVGVVPRLEINVPADAYGLVVNGCGKLYKMEEG